MRKMCKDCRHFRLKLEGGNKTGMCTINPPQTFATGVPLQSKDGSLTINWASIGAWPVVAADGTDSCGQFSPDLTN